MKAFRNRLRFPILLACMLAAAGCAKPDLIVLDSSGTPVEGAKIVGTSLSIGGQTSYSDSKGHANIPQAAQHTKWISIFKPGYKSIENIDVAQAKPIVVKMTKDDN